MTWSWLFFVACALLVAGGGYLVARDLMVPRGAPASPRPVPAPARPAVADPARDADVVIRTRPRPAPPSAATASAGLGAFDALLTTLATIRAGDDATMPPGDTGRVADLPERFQAVGPAVAEAIAHANAAVAQIGLAIGEAGETGWSFANRGYGTFRRVTIGGRSIGWLRLEATSAGFLVASMRSHEPEQALLNAQARTPLAGVGAQTVLDTLATAIEPAAKLAAWRTTRPVSSPAASPTAQSAPVSLPHAPPGQQAMPDPEPDTSDIGDVVAVALARAGDALIQRRCTLTLTDAAAFDPATGGQRRRAVLGRDGRAEATLDLVTTARTIDITVTSIDRTRHGLDRRHRLSAPNSETLSAAILACLAPIAAAV